MLETVTCIYSGGFIVPARSWQQDVTHTNTCSPGQNELDFIVEAQDLSVDSCWALSTTQGAVTHTVIGINVVASCPELSHLYTKPRTP